MSGDIAPLRLGSRVCFEDRWQGHVSSLDLNSDWELLNLTVSSGILMFQQTVKLPASAIKSLAGGDVYISATSTQAFANELPPVAAQAHRISAGTPISHAGAHVAGVIASVPGKRALELLLSRGLATYRVPVGQLRFDGETLTLTSAAEELAEFQDDADVLARIRSVITEEKSLMPADKAGVTTVVEDGVAILGGNVRVKSTAERIEALVSRVSGVVSVRNEISDDFALEAAIGLALDQQRLGRDAEVYARSTLGEVTLYGTVSSQRQAEEIVRAVVRVPGARLVQNLLSVRAAAAAR